MRILFLFGWLLSFQLNIYSQISSTNKINNGFFCASDEHHTFLMKTDPGYKARYLHQKTLLDSLKKAPLPSDRLNPPVYTIPVVVHVIHLGETPGAQTNISDEQIFSAIAGLNERFANINGIGNDIEIQFCLANRDPNGCPTSGINRVDGSSIPDYREEGITWGGDCGARERDVKDLSKWPTSRYYNIWVVSNICPESIAGYAYYPNGDEYDGCVIDYAYMTYESSTLSHELGHGFNLQHTFDDDDGTTCPPNDDCMEQGDEICDTPPHRQGDCGFNNQCSTEGIWDNSRYNWMSYCFPAFELGRFTNDQRTRMRNTFLVEPRASLLTSDGCSNPESMQITSDNSSICAGEQRILSAVPAGGYFKISEGTGKIEGDVLTPGGSGILVLEYILSNENCTTSVFQGIPVKPTPNSTLLITEDSLCSGQSTLLKAIPGGGSYSLISGPGMIDSNLLTALDGGKIEVMYEKLLLGCTSRDTQTVISFSTPTAGIDFLASDILTAIPDTGLFQWVRCDLDFEALPGANDAIYQPNESGSYAVILKRGMCSDTSACVELEITAIKNGEEDPQLTLYPNPVKDMLNIDCPLLQNDFDFEVTDLRGSVVIARKNQQHGTVQLDLSALVPGVYILKLDIIGAQNYFYRIMKD